MKVLRARAAGVVMLGFISSGCASAALGVDGLPVAIDLERVVWTDLGGGRYAGDLELVEPEDRDAAWSVVLLVSAATFERRGSIDIAGLPFPNRVYVLDPNQHEYRAVEGELALSPRGGGHLDARFARAGSMPSMELIIQWTSWHVEDRRVLHTPNDRAGDAGFTQ